MGDLTENFSSHEFGCPCCGRSDMNPEFMRKLQALRTEYGKPIRPVAGGGFRCTVYDGKKGAHSMGRAIDPHCPREDYPWLLEAAFYYGFTGIGVKNKGGNFQLHLDDAPPGPGRPRPWVWTY